MPGIITTPIQSKAWTKIFTSVAVFNTECCSNGNQYCDLRTEVSVVRYCHTHLKSEGWVQSNLCKHFACLIHVNWDSISTLDVNWLSLMTKFVRISTEENAFLWTKLVFSGAHNLSSTLWLANPYSSYNGVPNWLLYNLETSKLLLWLTLSSHAKKHLLCTAKLFFRIRQIVEHVA